MSRATNPNDNAFPMVVSESSSEAHQGLTKRELFAAILLAGICSDAFYPPFDAEYVNTAIICKHGNRWRGFANQGIKQVITLEATVVCDRCKTPIASGEPQEHWRVAVYSAIAAAKAKGAVVGLVTARCAECELDHSARSGLAQVMACGCYLHNRELCPHGNSPLA